MCVCVVCSTMRCFMLTRASGCIDFSIINNFILPYNLFISLANIKIVSVLLLSLKLSAYVSFSSTKVRRYLSKFLLYIPL